MAGYQTFTPEQAAIFANDHSELFGEHSQLSCHEFGDGNLNLVFRVKNQFGTSLIVKQALPYARCVGESWPLTLDRARIEAEVLLIHGKIVPDHTVEVLHYDAEQAAILLEDLGELQILRHALIAGKQLPLLAEHISTYLAQTSFYTSDFALDGPFKKARTSQFMNPELCLITEDLFFTDPYCNHERNQFDPALKPLATSLWFDEELKAEVAELKAKFESCPQALLHGDVHSGSIFVDKEHTKLIDGEFGFYGPIGFDLGCFIGNLLLNYCALPGLLTDETRLAQQQNYLREQLAATEQLFRQKFLALAARETKDLALQNEAYQRRFVQQVITDALGYAGTELIRRVIGLAHVADLEKITDKKRKQQSESKAVTLGRKLILQHRQLQSIETVLGWLQE